MHFHHQRSAGDKGHLDYVPEDPWRGKIERQDFVVCLECGHLAETLARHLKASHGITANDYRAKHGDVLIRCAKTTQARRAALSKSRQSPIFTGIKDVTCPSCGVVHQAHKMAMAKVLCPACKVVPEPTWEGLSETEDFVVCLECGHKAENLNSHFMSQHPSYRTLHPDAPVVALRSAVRDKQSLRGLRRSPDFKRKVSEAKTLGLTVTDFEPFLDPDGTVDTHAMSKVFGYAPLTLKKYMRKCGLNATRKYLENRGVSKRVILSVETLKGHALGNGKISVASATAGTGYCGYTIKKECRRLGLPWAHGNVTQKVCLEAISLVLGRVPYQEEWFSDRFRNPLTGHRFRFDGYFPTLGLVVEFHGHQHYTFPNAFMKESHRPEWDRMLERDRVKQGLIESAPDLMYFMVREDEPYTDKEYLSQRLLALGLSV